MWQRRLTVTLCALAIVCATPDARAAVVQDIQTDFAPAEGTGPYDPSFPIVAPFTTAGPSTTDALEGMMPSASIGDFGQEDSKGVAAFTDGTVATSYGDGTAASLHDAYGTAGDGSSVTYTLGGAYDIDAIHIYGGWNDGGRDEQNYDLQISSDGGVNFTSLGVVDTNPGVQGTDSTPISTRVSFTDDAAANLASSVTTIKVDFLGVENGYTGYTEIDMFGTLLTVPGDADRNGLVQMNDFIVISNNFLSTPSAAGLDGDVNFDNVVDQLDFREWKDIFSASASGATLGVPEPGSLVLIGIGAALGLGVFRRRK